MTLSTDERRALGLIAALLLLTALARWLERPRPLLEDAADLDVAALEAASRRAKPEAAAPAGPVDPNTATAAELARLPGVGPALAARIVEERGRRPFRTTGDLTRVRGIGLALATRLAGHVTLPVGPAPPAPPSGTALTPVESGLPAAPAGVRNGPLDLNEISATDLQRVPGVGPVLAARLLARRDSLRRFTRWEQVDEVAGVGPAMLARLREWLFIGPGP